MSLCICAIDPGVTGAIAFFFQAHPLHVSVHDMPVADGIVDGASLRLLLQQLSPNHVVIERVNAMPGRPRAKPGQPKQPARQMGATSAFNFGRSCGIVLGVVQGVGIPHTLVTPQAWKKHFNLSSDKDKSRALALATFTEATAHFKRVKDADRAEAALMALYGSHLLMTRETEAA